MDIEEIQQDIRANLRILGSSGNAFYLYQEKQISLSVLLTLISVAITDNYEIKVKE